MERTLQDYRTHKVLLAAWDRELLAFYRRLGFLEVDGGRNLAIGPRA